MKYFVTFQNVEYPDCEIRIAIPARKAKIAKKLAKKHQDENWKYVKLEAAENDGEIVKAGGSGGAAERQRGDS